MTTTAPRRCPVPGCNADTAHNYRVVPADKFAPAGRILNLYPCPHHAEMVRGNVAQYARAAQQPVRKGA